MSVKHLRNGSKEVQMAIFDIKVTIKVNDLSTISKACMQNMKILSLMVNFVVVFHLITLFFFGLCFVCDIVDCVLVCSLPPTPLFGEGGGADNRQAKTLMSLN